MPISDAKLQKLWLKYYPRVKGRIIDRINDNTAAEDIASEVFLGLVELVKKKSLRDETKIERIIWTITSRKIHDWLREKYRLNAQSTSAQEGSYPLNAFLRRDSVTEEYQSKEFSGHVMNSVSNLTDRQQQAFTMMVVDGVSRTDTAEKLDISESRVQHLVTRAKEKVADDLAQLYFPEPDNGQGELMLWVDKFYMAYLRLAFKAGKLTYEIEESAREAWVKIKERLEV